MFNRRVQVYTTEGEFVRSFTVPSRLWSTATDQSGNIYTAESDNHMIRKYSPTGQLLYSIGGQGGAHGQSTNPYGLAIGPAPAGSNGKLYVADTFNNRVEVFNSDNGQYIATYGRWGTGPGQFIAVRGVALDSAGNIYVLDDDNSRIQKLSPSGTYITLYTAASQMSIYM